MGLLAWIIFGALAGWVASLEDGRRCPLTQGESSVGDYEWSPNGEWIV